MQAVVNLDPDVEELLRAMVRERDLDFDHALNDAVRAGLSTAAPERDSRFVQKTHSLGSDRLDLTKALALADELEDQEIIRKMKLFEQQCSHPT